MKAFSERRVGSAIAKPTAFSCMTGFATGVLNMGLLVFRPIFIPYDLA